MFRPLAAILAATLLAAATALAQAPTPAPTTHPGTKLTFPPTLGGAQFERSFAYPAGRDAGYSYHYGANSMQITVYLFDGGRRVPAGSDSPTVVSQFASEISTAEAQLKSAGFDHFERPPVASTCAHGAVVFRCVVYSATAPGGRLYSKLLLTGFHDYFVKIRIDWAQSTGRTTADADHALQAFIPALMH